MDIGNYIMTPSVRQAVPLPQPPQAAMGTHAALLVAQNPAAQTRTQTTFALQASSGAEQSKTGQNRKQTAESVDSNANALAAKTNGKGGGSSRGQRLDVRI